MQISCPKCNARYVFDVSAIPKDGYNAQCTECGDVFFVSPQAQAGEEASPNAVHVAETVNVQAADTENIAPDIAPTKVPQAQVREEVVDTQSERPTSSNDSMGSGNPFDSQSVRNSVTEMPSFDAGIGADNDVVDDLPSEEEYQQKLQRKKKIILSIMGGIVGIVVVGGLLYAVVPTAFDATFGKVLGIKAAINPEAIPHKDLGIEKMLEDTPDALVAAIESFDKALAVDPEYPEAIAFKGLAYIFRGTDIQTQGRSVYDEGSNALSKLKELKSVPRRKRTKKVKKKIDELTDLAQAKSKESTELFEKGGKEVSNGYGFIRKALGKYQQEPSILAAAGIYYTTDPDGIAKAQMFLRAGLDQTIGANVEMDLKSPPNILLPYLQGVIRASSEKDMNQALAAFDAALAQNGKFVRAIMEKALILEKQGELDAAKKLAQKILTTAAKHSRAKILLARLEQGKSNSANN